MFKLLIVQAKILFRYSGLFTIGFFYNGLAIYLIWQFTETGININIPFFVIFLNLFLVGPYMFDYFPGGIDELKNYILIPESFKNNYLMKIGILIIFVILMSIISILIISFYMDISIFETRTSFIFILSSLPAYIILGNYLNCRMLNDIIRGDGAKKTLVQVIISIISITPYLILGFWLNNFTYAVVFCVLVLSSWYFWVLPNSIIYYQKFTM